jgi:hypothetical protein
MMMMVMMTTFLLHLIACAPFKIVFSGDDVDDIGVLHSTMAAAGYGVTCRPSSGEEAGAGGRRVRERSVLDPSWRMRFDVSAAIWQLWSRAAAS